jgi:hypothetical protein
MKTRLGLRFSIGTTVLILMAYSALMIPLTDLISDVLNPVRSMWLGGPR